MAATTQYRITYTVPAGTRLQALIAAGGMLRTGVSVVNVVKVEPTVPGWWSVALFVEETLSDPPEPKWLHESAPDPVDAYKGWQESEKAWGR